MAPFEQLTLSFFAPFSKRRKSHGFQTAVHSLSVAPSSSTNKQQGDTRAGNNWK
ncbi:MAG: hypothetical protein ACFFD4_39620 [Candidatus Odinarchaeota archaeon]